MESNFSDFLDKKPYLKNIKENFELGFYFNFSSYDPKLSLESKKYRYHYTITYKWEFLEEGEEQEDIEDTQYNLGESFYDLEVVIIN